MAETLVSRSGWEAFDVEEFQLVRLVLIFWFLMVLVEVCDDFCGIVGGRGGEWAGSDGF